ncbi:MAG: hypothetical protein ACYDG2_13495 [Ruminiclostridium sp.]
MNRSFLILCTRPVNFEDKSFQENFIKEFSKIGVNISRIEKWKDFGNDRDYDILNYEFETDYDFGVIDEDPFSVGIIYEKIIDIKREYNDIQDRVKIKAVLLIDKELTTI